MKHCALMITVALAIGLVVRTTAQALPNVAHDGSKQLPVGMVRIPAGSYHPFYHSTKVDSERVESFYLDITPVTNKEFLEFVVAHPEWARSKVSPMLASEGYLRKWRGDFAIGDPTLEDLPVVDVSWFAARAYAAWRHKRLPTIAEWEYAALAPLIRPRRATGEAKRDLILKWYTRPDMTVLEPVGTVCENGYGVKDMFGQAWEWVEDFNSIVIPSESGSNMGALCGAAAAGALDATDYAGFMRFALRNSLKANDVTDQLGFRCAESSSHEFTERQ